MSPAALVETTSLVEYVTRLGDNTLILSHRVAEWCGHAPVLEEDIALANIALDLLGQTQLWLGLAGELEGQGRTAEDLAFLRDANAFRNFHLVEQPNTDFAVTLVRQFFFDAWHLPMLKALEASSEQRIADIAAKSVKEVTYHLERSTDLVVRLGDGSEESHARMQAAVNDLWRLTGEMFEADAVDEAVAASGVGSRLEGIQLTWNEYVADALETATLTRPDDAFAPAGGKKGVHTEHLGYILAEMQFLQRAYPGATW